LHSLSEPDAVTANTTTPAGSDAAFLQFEAVDFGYRGSTPIFDSFDLDVEQGEFVALLGPSGCGKSTLLNLTAGFVGAQSGRVLFDGNVVSKVNTDVAYMTQQDTLLPWRTVAANVRLPLEIRHVAKAEINERVDSILRLVGLDHAKDRFPAQLSGGMNRRALLARSLIGDPKVLLMDEPFAALDAQLRDTMHRELLEVVARFGRTVLFVTHDISESILLSDRVVMLGGGPCRIIDDVAIPFGKDRNLDDVSVAPEYLELATRLRGALAQVRNGGE
jgi:NitT/TauT family transport system ATP-binding protein